MHTETAHPLIDTPYPSEPIDRDDPVYWAMLKEGRPVRAPRYMPGDTVIARGQKREVVGVRWHRAWPGDGSRSSWVICTAGYSHFERYFGRADDA